MNLVIMLDVFGMGGSERTALVLINALMQLEYINLSVVVFAKNDTRISKKTYKLPDNIDVNYIYNDNYSPLKKLLLVPISLYKVRKILINKNIEKIVSFLDYPNLINILLKNILHHQAFTSERKYSKHAFANKRTYMKYFLQFVFNNSDIVIVNDIDIKKSLVNDFLIKTDIAILNNLIATNGYVSDFSKENKQIIFITVARFTSEKNTKDIIYAFSKIHANNMILQIIGDGPQRNFLKNLTIELKIESKVQFLGQVDNVYSYLQKADIFVFSSLSEGFPNAVLEAMYAGLPIISYQFKAGITSMLDDGKYGVLVKLNDVDSLAKNMFLFANDNKLRQKYSKLSKKRSEMYIDKTKYINDFLSILEGDK